jgi:hypothetical protein
MRADISWLAGGRRVHKSFRFELMVREESVVVRSLLNVYIVYVQSMADVLLMKSTQHFPTYYDYTVV